MCRYSISNDIHLEAKDEPFHKILWTDYGHFDCPSNYQIKISIIANLPGWTKNGLGRKRELGGRWGKFKGLYQRCQFFACKWCNFHTHLFPATRLVIASFCTRGMHCSMGDLLIFYWNRSQRCQTESIDTQCKQKTLHAKNLPAKNLHRG